MSSSQTIERISYVAYRGYVERVEIAQCPIHHLIAGAQYSPSGWQVLHDEIDSRAGAGGYLSAVKTVSGNDTAGAVPDRHPGLARATLDRATRAVPPPPRRHQSATGLPG
jgi:hypothetical protein